MNAEPITPRCIERNFGNMNGNLYELEHTDDFVDNRFKFIGVESLSKFDDKADLRVAVDEIGASTRPCSAAQQFKLDTSGLIAKLVRNVAGRRAQLLDQIRSYRDTVFGRDTQQAVLKPMLEQMGRCRQASGCPTFPRRSPADEF